MLPNIIKTGLLLTNAGEEALTGVANTGATLSWYNAGINSAIIYSGIQGTGNTWADEAKLARDALVGLEFDPQDIAERLQMHDFEIEDAVKKVGKWAKWLSTASSVEVHCDNADDFVWQPMLTSADGKVTKGANFAYCLPHEPKCPFEACQNYNCSVCFPYWQKKDW